MKTLFKLIFSIIIINLYLNCLIFGSDINIVKLTIGSNIAVVNGENVTLNIAPYIQENSNTTLVPLRFVTVALGIPESNITFNANNKEITITYKDDIYTFIVGTSQIKINDDIYNMTMKNVETEEFTYIYTEIKDGFAFVPLRAFENMGMKFSWDSITKTATITSESSSHYASNEADINNENSNLTEQEIREIEEEVIRLVNEERANYGLNPLEIDETLMGSARFKSEDMVNNNYYSHTSPIYGDFTELLSLFNISYQYAGENIARGQKTAKSVVVAWLNSEGHRENILNPNFKYIGVGFCVGVKGDNTNYPYWTQHFSG